MDQILSPIPKGDFFFPYSSELPPHKTVKLVHASASEFYIAVMWPCYKVMRRYGLQLTRPLIKSHSVLGKLGVQAALTRRGRV